MAGGPHARVVACDLCGRLGTREPAERTYEGSEDDHYRCARGHTFGIHWRQPATGPMFEAGEPDREGIAARAYYRHLARRDAGREGDALEDWLEAEREARRWAKAADG